MDMRRQYNDNLNITELIPKALTTDNNEIIERICRNNGMQFTDPGFPPSIRSLTSDQLRPAWRDIKWARISDFDPEHAEIKPLVSGELSQNLLGNGYFISAISFLSSTPSLLTRLFAPSLSPTTSSLYLLYLNINGLWTELLLDDYLPLSDVTGSSTLGGSPPAPALCLSFLSPSPSSGTFSYLPSILEKGYAKAFSSYSSIECGDTLQALRDLTGAPFARFEDLADVEGLWDRVAAARGRGWVVVATPRTPRTSTPENLRTTQLEEEAVEEVREGEKKEVRVRKAREEVGGGRWVDVQLAAKEYEQIGVCMIEKDFFSDGVVVEMEHSNKAIVLFSLEQESEVTVSLDQMDKRTFANPAGYRYSYMRISVGRVSSEDIQFVDCQLSCSRNIFISETLPPGKYVVLVEAYWACNHTRKLVVGLYSSSRPKMSLTSANNQIFNKTEYMLWDNFAKNNREALKRKSLREILDTNLSAPIEM